MFSDPDELHSVAEIFLRLSMSPPYQGTGDGEVARRLCADLMLGGAKSDPLLFTEMLTRTTAQFREDWLAPFIVCVMSRDAETLSDWVERYKPAVDALFPPPVPEPTDEAEALMYIQLQAQARRTMEQVRSNHTGIPPQVTS